MHPYIEKAFLNHLPEKPGVYQMLDEKNQVIYVGKAKNLKNRVSSYFLKGGLTTKTILLVSHIRQIDITVTLSENEALLLEANLIKKLKPRYNILLKDDKSYPYLFISDHPFPKIKMHRGEKKEKGQYFGPYPSSSALRETLNLLQKLFKIRSCEDAFFTSRSRPCLQYQIDRCTAPCVAYINQMQYQNSVNDAVLFLKGKDSEIVANLVREMEAASQALSFEKAALYRDKIAKLRQIYAKQIINTGRVDTDILFAYLEGGLACIAIFTVRGGHLLGSRTVYPRLPDLSSTAEVLEAFVLQYYLSADNEDCPSEIILNEALQEQALFASALSMQKGKKVHIYHPVKGEKQKWLQMAEETAKNALQAKLSLEQHALSRFRALTLLLERESDIKKMACLDISHFQGEASVGSYVVFDQKGPKKTEYRRFNITDVEAGDDYAALEQVLKRQFNLTKKTTVPDLVVIDGGKGQLHRAIKTMQALNLPEMPLIVGIKKGLGRLEQYDELILPNGKAILLSSYQEAGALLSQIRNEAHRFAISAHRKQRDKKRIQSVLDSIDGVGPLRKKALLGHFGGLAGLKKASIEEIAELKGISLALAKTIYSALHHTVF